MKVLFVEDNTSLRNGLAQLLQPTFRLELAATLQEAETLCESTHFDLAIVDLSLPDGSGRTLCRRHNFANPRLPIIILTAEFTNAMRTTLLQEGADDYLTKPFCPRELQARISAVLRRTVPPTKQPEISLCAKSRTISYRNQTAKLTRTEFEILEKLYYQAGQVISFAEMLDSIWENDRQPFSNALNVHLGRLRRKLAFTQNKLTITCHRTLGVQLV